jgi:hypothetical protein
MGCLRKGKGTTMNTSFQKAKVTFGNKHGGFIQGPGTMAFSYRGRAKNSGIAGNVTFKAEVFDKDKNLLGSSTKTIHLDHDEVKEFVINCTVQIEAADNQHWAKFLGDDFYLITIEKEEPD